MNWNVGEIGWAGQDSVFNKFRVPRWQALFVVALCVITVLPAVVCLLALPFASPGDREAISLQLRQMLRGNGGHFVNRTWSLSKRSRALAFRTAEASGSASLLYGPGASEEWDLRLDDIASVEAGRTVDWQGVRRWFANGSGGDRVETIPDAEYQTFIMTRDGRRLVILTANADREGTLALALSIKGWVEAQRSASAPASAIEPGPMAEGLTL